MANRHSLCAGTPELIDECLRIVSVLGRTSTSATIEGNWRIDSSVLLPVLTRCLTQSPTRRMVRMVSMT